MGLSVSQALKFGGLAKGRVLCGERFLSNEIELVSIIEAPLEANDPQWQINKTLFLTTFYAIKDNLAGQIKAIEILAENGCSALVFQTWILTGLSEAVVQRAEDLGLPIIEVAEEVTYPDIIQPLVGAILKEKTYLLQRSEEIHQRMIDLCLNGGGLDAIAASLSDLIDRPVIILDAWGSQLAACLCNPDTFLFKDTFKIQFSQKITSPSHLVYLPDEKFWMAKLFSGSGRESDGYIIIMNPDSQLNSLDQIAIEQASVIAALEMAKQRAVLETERRLQRDFIENLLFGQQLSENIILTRAHSLGWDLSGKKVIAVINLDQIKKFYLSRAGSTEDEYNLAKNLMFRTINNFMVQNNPGCILVEQGDYLILIPECAGNISIVQIRKDLSALADTIHSLINETLGDNPTMIVFGGFYETILGLRNSYEEAKSTLKVCQNQSFRQNVAWYDDVALYVLLDRIASQPDTRQWFERTIGRLIDYDRENGASLVQTLEAYFDANQQIQPAAYHLFVHPKTLKYRLRRIEEILGTNPFSKEQHLSYYLACKLAKMVDVSGKR